LFTREELVLGCAPYSKGGREGGKGGKRGGGQRRRTIRSVTRSLFFFSPFYTLPRKRGGKKKGGEEGERRGLVTSYSPTPTLFLGKEKRGREMSKPSAKRKRGHAGGAGPRAGERKKRGREGGEGKLVRRARRRLSYFAPSSIASFL